MSLGHDAIQDRICETAAQEHESLTNKHYNKMTDLQKTETGLSTGGGFLPPQYKTPDRGKQFMKLEPGDNEIRVLSAPLYRLHYFYRR